jgi:mRNA interferase MazF
MAIHRGEVYFINLNPVVGREQSGTRPVLVISSDHINQKPLVVIVVIGTKGGNIPINYPCNVRVPASASGLPMETVFMGFQIRSVDKSRFPEHAAGQITEPYLSLIEEAVEFCLDL